MKILRFLLARVASPRPIALAVLCLVIGFALLALAQVPNTLIHSISPPPGVQGYSQLGHSVAEDGGRTVVVAPYDNTVGANSGVAKVFNSITGALLHVRPNPAPAETTFFGISVSISGKWVVGAGGKVSSTTPVRSVYVYDLSSGTPTVPVFTLDQPSPMVADNFGRSVAVSDGWVVVGAPLTDVGLDVLGAAYLYNLNSPTPTGLVAVFKSPSLVKDDRFAWSVAISGTRVTIGAFLDDTGAGNAGSA